MASYGFWGYSVRLRPGRPRPLCHTAGGALSSCAKLPIAEGRKFHPWHGGDACLSCARLPRFTPRHAMPLASPTDALHSLSRLLPTRTGHFLVFFFRATVTVNRVHGAAAILVLHPLEYGYSIGCCGSAYSKLLLEYG